MTPNGANFSFLFFIMLPGQDTTCCICHKFVKVKLKAGLTPCWSITEHSM